MSDTIIQITEIAKEKIKHLLLEEIEKRSLTESEKLYLRLSVIGGGCSGLSYKMDFSTIKENDQIISYGDFQAVLDPKSLIYLEGITLDYTDGLSSKGFVFKNPNAANTCGCGESFSV
jgi:iron-sulfur cluster assembly protein